MPRTTLPLLAVATVVAVAVGVTSAPAADTGSTFALDSRLEKSSFVQIDQKPKGHSPGDTFVFATQLRRDGAVSGRAEYVQSAVDKRYEGVLMHVQLLLKDGTIALQGAGVNKAVPGAQTPRELNTLAVVGGTGTYAGATGEVIITDTGETTQRLEVRLR